MSMGKKRLKPGKSDGHLIVGLLATFGIAFTLFGIQMLRELLSIKPSIVHTSLFLIIGLGMLFFAIRVIGKRT